MDLEKPPITQPRRTEVTRVRDAELRRALELLEQRQAAERDCRDALARARDRVQTARDEIHRRLDDLALVRTQTGERPLDEDEVRELYWDWPEVHVKKIGAVIGVHQSDVHKLIGRSAPVACRGCGAVIDHRPASRATPGATTGLCDSCLRRQDERHREWTRSRRARDAERIEALRRGGYWITGDGELLDPTDVEGFLALFGWCYCRGGGTGTLQPEILNDAEAWHKELRLHYRCRACAHSATVPLARYVEPVD